MAAPTNAIVGAEMKMTPAALDAGLKSMFVPPSLGAGGNKERVVDSM
jgi:hypothetical protein